MIGLGAGVILRYARPGTTWTVYEIDPAIARVAQDPRLFSHWAEAAVAPALVIGDGRLRLRDALDGSYDLIVVDAFASDSVPVHLLTREVMQLYARKLRMGGVTLFNVSNRYVDLAPVLGATASPLGLVALRAAATNQRFDGGPVSVPVGTGGTAEPRSLATHRRGGPPSRCSRRPGLDGRLQQRVRGVATRSPGP